MKAVSLKQPWASWIAEGQKTIETRTWPTNYRGELLICASKRPKVEDLPAGQAVAVVNLADCRPMTDADQPAAMCEIYDGAYAWLLTNIRKIKPFDVRGALGVFDVDVRPDDLTVEKVTRVCRECGCTDARACIGGCQWVQQDLCSQCASAMPARSPATQESGFQDEC